MYKEDILYIIANLKEEAGYTNSDGGNEHYIEYEIWQDEFLKAPYTSSRRKDLSNMVGTV